MKSLNNLNRQSISTPILADNLVEFHAARLLLLFQVCGVNGQMNGLTKMAKLDFFVRYPQFFSIACQSLGKNFKSTSDTVESNMIRFHYGPWDHRYYQTLAYLKSRGLLEIKKDGKAYTMTLTSLGLKIAAQFENMEIYASLVEQMRNVNEMFGKMNGSQLKQLVYKVFDEQVAKLKLGEVIT
jgi:hypothetical protein